MNRGKLEKLRHWFGVTCAIGIGFLIINTETTWLNFISERILLLVIPLVIAIGFIGMWITNEKINLIGAYEKGRYEEKLFQAIEKKKKEGKNPFEP